MTHKQAMPLDHRREVEETNWEQTKPITREEIK